MRIALTLITISLILLLPSTAGASLAGEQHQGQNRIAELQAGTRTCRALSASDLDHIGEYLMFRALGSARAHQAMNDRMITMLGHRGESRMHQVLGARYTGCATTRGAASGSTGMMGGGGGMMGGYDTASGGFGAMMSSSNWSWMMGGAWRTLTRPDWRRVQHQLLGADVNTSHHGWSMAATIAAVVAGALLLVLGIVAAMRRTFRRPRAPSPSR